MEKSQERQRSYLFTLRLWPEGLGDGETEWRGKAQHVLSGEARYFRDWPALAVFLEETVPKPDDRQGMSSH